MYLDFWPLVSRVWKMKFGIDPVLIYVDDEDSDIDNTYGKVYKMKPIPNYSTVLQSQFARIWLTTLFPEDICVLTDIDMFPISKKYFVEQLGNISDDKYVHINPSHIIYKNVNIPLCYNIAKGSTFTNVLNIDKQFDKFLIHNNVQDNWCADEHHITTQVQKYDDQTIFINLPRDGGQNGRRIDRSKWNYDPDLFSIDFYYDSHSIRPYSENKEEIDKLITHILK
jgi:hypothetical protein